MQQSTYRQAGIWAVVGALAVLVGVIVVISGKRSPKASTAKRAQVLAQEKRAAETRIAQLSFKCIERFVCQADFPNYPLPLFIDGLDEPLHSYLEHHGYEDSWTDNSGFLHAHTFIRGENQGDESYVSFQRALPKAGGSGYIYVPFPTPPPYGPGPVPDKIPRGGTWTITWRLKDPSGHVVRTLHYSVKVVSCGIAASSYCNKVGALRVREGELGTSVEENEPYSPTFYKPPPLFSYKE